MKIVEVLKNRSALLGPLVDDACVVLWASVCTSDGVLGEMVYGLTLDWTGRAK